ncbi:MAG: glycerol-3-phosphate 1-O-acyltransferase PlsY [Clostridia bacterium]|nr:glycerol-3-phosphate 1-O-acyltransferase PlsY [Clostridia bacterium]
MSIWYILIVVVGYLIGSINLSIVLTKKVKGIDIRKEGSGNAGTTNTLRVLGKKYAAIVLLFDILKGVIVILIAMLISPLVADANLLISLGGLAVILGHNFPLYYNFKGGKGVATTLGIILIVTPSLGCICLIFGLIIIALTKMVSVGSILAAILYPILVLFLAKEYFIFALFVSLLLIFRHRKNIKKILEGNESKISLFKKKE